MEVIEDRVGKTIFTIEAENCLLREESSYQLIEVYQTEPFGKVLVLDTNIQTTEKDEFYYHEMLVHPVLFAYGKLGNVLLVGGGDGGALEEILKHNPDKVTMVEIDKRVVEISYEYLRSINRGSFYADNVELIFADAFEFLRDTDRIFDVMIIDCPDPVGPGRILYTKEFYQMVYEHLSSDGMISVQTESPFLQPAEHKLARSAIASVFDKFYPYIGIVPAYPCGIWSYIVATKTDIDPTIIRSKISISDLKYYSPEKQKTLFIKPGWYIRQFESEE